MEGLLAVTILLQSTLLTEAYVVGSHNDLKINSPLSRRSGVDWSTLNEPLSDDMYPSSHYVKSGRRALIPSTIGLGSGSWSVSGSDASGQGIGNLGASNMVSGNRKQVYSQSAMSSAPGSYSGYRSFNAAPLPNGYSSSLNLQFPEAQTQSLTQTFSELPVHSQGSVPGSYSGYRSFNAGSLPNGYSSSLNLQFPETQTQSLTQTFSELPVQSQAGKTTTTVSSSIPAFGLTGGQNVEYSIDSITGSPMGNTLYSGFRAALPPCVNNWLSTYIPNGWMIMGLVHPFGSTGVYYKGSAGSAASQVIVPQAEQISAEENQATYEEAATNQAAVIPTEIEQGVQQSVLQVESEPVLPIGLAQTYNQEIKMEQSVPQTTGCNAASKQEEAVEVAKVQEQQQILQAEQEATVQEQQIQQAEQEARVQEQQIVQAEQAAIVQEQQNLQAEQAAKVQEQEILQAEKACKDFINIHGAKKVLEMPGSVALASGSQFSSTSGFGRMPQEPTLGVGMPGSVAYAASRKFSSTSGLEGIPAEPTLGVGLPGSVAYASGSKFSSTSGLEGIPAVPTLGSYYRVSGAGGVGMPGSVAYASGSKFSSTSGLEGIPAEPTLGSYYRVSGAGGVGMPGSVAYASGSKFSSTSGVGMPGSVAYGRKFSSSGASGSQLSGMGDSHNTFPGTGDFGTHEASAWGSGNRFSGTGGFRTSGASALGSGSLSVAEESLRGNVMPLYSSHSSESHGASGGKAGVYGYGTQGFMTQGPSHSYSYSKRSGGAMQAVH